MSTGCRARQLMSLNVKLCLYKLNWITHRFQVLKEQKNFSIFLYFILCIYIPLIRICIYTFIQFSHFVEMFKNWVWFRLCSRSKKWFSRFYNLTATAFYFDFYEKYKLFPEYFKRYSLYLQYKNSPEKHFSERNSVEHLKWNIQKIWERN